MSFQPILLPAHNPGPMTGAGNNTFLLGARSGYAVLIDAGVGNERHLSDLDAQLSANGWRLDRVLVTHGHVDHASGAPGIRARHPDAVFAKHPWPEEDPHHGFPWLTLADGDLVPIDDSVMTVLFTPGHSPDHVAFWHEPTRSIFTGDLLIPGGSVMIHTSRGGDLAAYLASLERLLTLEPRVLFPAHGPRIDDPADVIGRHLEHRRMRERQVVDALRHGDRTVQAIAESIYHGLDPALMPAARENVRAHLDKLKQDGIADEGAGEWTLG